MGTSDGQGWREIFPYEPYEQQITGIQCVRETLSNGGIQLIEGPCGSGKTLMSLCAGLSLIQGNSQYSRILVITSKKQQLSAFEDDIEEINARDGFHFPALSLVGKPDVCPYVEAGTIEADDIYGECFRLRDNTREIADELVESGAVSNKHRAASILVNHSKKQVAHRSDALHVDQTLTDHPEQIPEGMEKQYCPFYASHIINMIEERSPLSVNEVTSGQEILQTASACGTCPHMEMRRLFPSATVVIGNYQHVCDPRTVRGGSGSLFDE
jgi:DNA excision repair protein ERCC-2